MKFLEYWLSSYFFMGGQGVNGLEGIKETVFGVGGEVGEGGHDTITKTA